MDVNNQKIYETFLVALKVDNLRKIHCMAHFKDVMSSWESLREYNYLKKIRKKQKEEILTDKLH